MADHTSLFHAGADPDQCERCLTGARDEAAHRAGSGTVIVTLPPIRIRRRRIKGWRMPEGAVYVGRPTRWGNPITIAEMRKHYPDEDLAELHQMMMSDYLGHLIGKFEPREDWPALPDLATVRRELRGRDLVCWCPLEYACHAEVLLALANE